MKKKQMSKNLIYYPKLKKFVKKFVKKVHKARLITKNELRKVKKKGLKSKASQPSFLARQQMLPN